METTIKFVDKCPMCKKSDVFVIYIESLTHPSERRITCNCCEEDFAVNADTQKQLKHRIL
jgi:hypothetical protein